jgi:adenine-specific DNA methylase
MKLMAEASVEKLRGGFYTPEIIAEFIAKWGTNESADFDILEPSCGDGVFLEQIKKHKLKYTTDTMHRVFLKPGTKIESFTASYYNSLSLAFTEVCGRSHGGGVLELMPNEAERVLLPYNKDNSSLVPIIDKLLRKKTGINEILKITDEIILKEHYRLTNKEIKIAHSIWEKLSYRRLNRGK